MDNEAREKLRVNDGGRRVLTFLRDDACGMWVDRALVSMAKACEIDDVIEVDLLWRQGLVQQRIGSDFNIIRLAPAGRAALSSTKPEGAEHG